jgi:hypothetical protein
MIGNPIRPGRVNHAPRASDLGRMASLLLEASGRGQTLMTNKKHIGFGLIVVVALAALSITQKSYSQSSTENSRLIISFQSRASGIDRGTKKEIDEFISKYEKEKGVQLAKEVVRWGREGEVDYCFKLSELSKEDQKDFVSGIKPLAGGSKQTVIVENAPCRSKGRK